MTTGTGDPLAEMLTKLIDPLGNELCRRDGEGRHEAEYLATAVRSYWREHRPTREEVARVLYNCHPTLSVKQSREMARGDADAIIALFDRVWGEK